MLTIEKEIKERKLSEGEIKILLDSAVIVIDTREQKNKHIIDYLDKRKIKWVNMKLDSGDYSIMLPNNKQVQFPELYLNNFIVIERKKTLDELVGNLTNGRDRFFREFQRFNGKMVIMVEENSYKDVLTHNYRSQMNEVALNSSIMKISSEFGIETIWLNDTTGKVSPIFVLSWLKSQLKAYLRTIDIIDEENLEFNLGVV